VGEEGASIVAGWGAAVGAGVPAGCGVAVPTDKMEQATENNMNKIMETSFSLIDFSFQ
jgi:hypothetical protein